MSRTRFSAALCLALVAVSFALGGHASASTGLTDCGTELLADRVEASHAVISGTKWFAKDNIDFGKVVFDDDTLGELRGDRNETLRDLAQDFRDALSDIRAARRDAVSEFNGGDCTGATAKQFRREMRFYARTAHRLRVAYAKAIALLAKQFAAARLACCRF